MDWGLSPRVLADSSHSAGAAGAIGGKNNGTILPKKLKPSKKSSNHLVEGATPASLLQSQLAGLQVEIYMITSYITVSFCL